MTGEEGDIAREFIAAACALGLQAEADAVGNVIVRKPGRGSGPRLALSGHLDTVPAREPVPAQGRRAKQRAVDASADMSATL